MMNQDLMTEQLLRLRNVMDSYRDQFSNVSYYIVNSKLYDKLKALDDSPNIIWSERYQSLSLNRSAVYIDDDIDDDVIETYRRKEPLHEDDRGFLTYSGSKIALRDCAVDMAGIGVI